MDSPPKDPIPHGVGFLLSILYLLVEMTKRQEANALDHPVCAASTGARGVLTTIGINRTNQRQSLDIRKEDNLCP